MNLIYNYNLYIKKNIIFIIIKILNIIQNFLKLYLSIMIDSSYSSDSSDHSHRRKY